MKDPLPRFGDGDVDHSAKDPAGGGGAEDRRAQNSVEVLGGMRVVTQYQLLRGAAESLSDVGVEAALPIAVAERGGRRCDRELVGYEVVVCHRIGGEVREISESERTKRFRLGVIVDLETDCPRMAVPAGGGVLFRDA